MGKILTMAHHILSWIWEVIEEIFMGEKLPMDEVKEDMGLPEVVNTGPTPQEKLLCYARQYNGVDASPQDDVDDSLGCAESVSNVIKRLYPDFPIIYATWFLKDELDKDDRFEGTLELEPGAIIVSPTGTGNGSIRGHTGILGEDNVIYSNNSFTGIWEPNYTIDSWVTRYRTRGGLKIYVYKPVGDIPKT